MKKRVRLAKGSGSFQSAWRTLQTFEMMNMIGQGRVRGRVKAGALGQDLFIAELIGIAVKNDVISHQPQWSPSLPEKFATEPTEAGTSGPVDP